MFLHVFLLLAILLGARLEAQEPATPWFTVTAASPEVSAAAVARVQVEAQAALQGLQKVFRDLPRQRFHIVLHRDAGSLPAALRAAHHEGSPGLAWLPRHEIHLLWAEMAEVRAGMRAVIVHEMVHELIHQLAAPHGDRIPRWLHEGLAQELAGDNYLGADENDLIWRVAGRSLFSFTELAPDFPRSSGELRTAYGQSHSFVSFLVREHGVQAVLRMIDMVDPNTTFEEAMVIVTGRSTVALQDRWREYLLHDSGARFRVLLESCFSLLVVLALPLAVLALMRRLASDRRARERMAVREQLEDTMPIPEAQPEPPSIDEVEGDDDDENREDDENDENDQETDVARRVRHDGDAAGGDAGDGDAGNPPREDRS